MILSLITRQSRTGIRFYDVINFQIQLQTIVKQTAISTRFIKPLKNVIFNIIIGQLLLSSKFSLSERWLNLNFGCLSLMYSL